MYICLWCTYSHWVYVFKFFLSSFFFLIIFFQMSSRSWWLYHLASMTFKYNKVFSLIKKANPLLYFSWVDFSRIPPLTLCRCIFVEHLGLTSIMVDMNMNIRLDLWEGTFIYNVIKVVFVTCGSRLCKTTTFFDTNERAWEEQVINNQINFLNFPTNG
jgi:hypothetical protein